MKRLLSLLIVVLCSCVVGCGGGGGSSNPVSPNTGLQVVSISPTSGGPGTEVSIQGRGFGPVQGTNYVTYSGVTVTVTSWTENLIRVMIPSSATGNGVFQISINGTLSNQSSQFSLSNPIITGVNPSSGGPGTQVTISGQYFGTTQGSSYVSFNGQPVSITTWSNTQISCVLPNTSNSQPGNVSVIVMVDGTRPSNTAQFNLTVPTISGVNPSTDNIGAQISIIGSGFGYAQTTTQGASQITIGGMSPQVISWSDTLIMAKIPQVSSGGAYNVIVTVNSKQSSPFALNVSAPTITGVSPTKLVKDQTVTISGQYFGTSTSEGPGTIQLQDGGTIYPISWTDSQIQFTCPIGGYLGTEDKTLTISVGGLTITRTVTIE